MDLLEELISLGKKCSILYVEDDKDLQIETEKVLSRIFDKVFVANNGKDGFDIFEQEKIDLVLTDIEMPVMNGLKMSQKIKKLNATCPIVVLSAYSTSDYFIEAIENSIDDYVLKPVNTKKLLDTLYKACKRLEDKRMAEAYKEQQIKEHIDGERQRMLSEISNASPNPMLVYCDGKLTFSNHTFEKLFSSSTLMQKIANEKALEAYLNEIFAVDEVLKDVDDLNLEFKMSQLDELDRKVALMTNEGKKIFMMLKSPFKLVDKDEAILYTFNDITELLYQQMQLDLYSKKLSSTIEDNFVTKQPKNNGIINKVEFDI